MKMSFVIPAYNEELYLGKCLDAIFSEIQQMPGDYEVIVANNTSTDRTREVALRYLGVKVVDEPHKGLVWARRAAYLPSTGDLLAHIDADVMIPEGWIKKILSAFEKDPRLVAASGPFIYYDLPRRIGTLVRAWYALAYLTNTIMQHVFRVSGMLQGGNFVVRRSALETIGGYDTTISFYGEDTDLARRLSPIGKILFTSRLAVKASGRRLAREGICTTAARYALNYFWTVVFKRPYTRNYTDIRPENTETTLVHAPGNKRNERVIAATIVFVFLVLLGGLGWGISALADTLFPGTFTITNIEAATEHLRQNISTNLHKLDSSMSYE